MNYTLLKRCLLFALILLFNINAQSQYWIQKGTSSAIQEAIDIATDASGNSYTTGFISSTTSFGSLTATTAGSSDIFLTKTNSSGVFQWAVTAGGGSVDRGYAVACDASGNVFVTGFFNGTAIFGTSSVTSSGAQDVFIAKYNSSGVLQWVLSAGGSNADISNGIAIDNQGNAIICGQFIGTATFGSTTLVSSNNSIDIFVAKVSSAGAFVWAKKGSGKLEDRALAVSCDGTGNSYITGQFSDTLTFDVVHNNTMQNAVFLVKLNSSGDEQWFRTIGGGGYNIAYDIVTDNIGNSYLTGDFQGNLTFYGSPPTSLIGTENFKIFIAKYNSSGALTWAEKAGSSDEVSSRTIDLDNSGNVYIAGHFKCIFDDFSAEYGEAIFNSVGKEDIFMAKYSSSGTFAYARHLGNIEIAKANGIACDNSNRPVFCGYFSDNLNIPTSNSFLNTNLQLWTDISCQPTLSYCSDSDYGQFHQISNSGNSEIVIANCFDPNREPYDYFLRSGGSCFRDYPAPTIENGIDSITACVLSTNTLSYDSITCYQAGPEVFYQYTSSNISSSSVYHIVKANFPDNCIPDLIDSTVVSQFPSGVPPKPTISDDVILNTNALTPVPIRLCNPATVELTAGNLGSNSYAWYLDGSFLIANQASITPVQSGIYTVEVEDANGCTRSNEVLVVFYDPLPVVDLRVYLPDSLSFCENDVSPISFHVYDTISNPSATPSCLGMLIPGTTIQAYNVSSTTVILPTPVGSNLSCQLTGTFTPDTTAWYVFSSELTYYNECDTIVYNVLDSVYIEVIPAPAVDSFFFDIVGPSFLCPGDTAQLVAITDTNFVWLGPGVSGSQADTINITNSGTYTIFYSYTDTNSFGCTTYNLRQAEHVVNFISAPSITSDSTFLCPGDTATLVVSSNISGSSNFSWQGPTGNLGINSDTIQVTTSGLYYCSIGDSNCYFESNTIEIIQYTTPNISAAGNPVLCPGDSVVLSVSATNSSLINWFFPLSGSSPYQVVDSAGYYQCEVTSCGITSIAGINVIPSTSTIDIFKSGVLCADSFATMSVNPIFTSYAWSNSILDTSTVFVTDSGTYSIIAIDTDGCVVTDTAFIDLDQIFADIETVNNNALCFGDSITIGAVTGLSTYKWLPNNETTRQITVTKAGTYTLIATDSNGCRSTSDPTVIFTPDTTAKVIVSGNLSFCEGDSVILTTPTNGKFSYSWNSTLTDSNALVIDSSGTFTVNVIDTFGCLAKSAPIIVFVQKYLLNSPALQDTTICIGDAASFITDVVGTIQWYDSTNKEKVMTGNTYVTPNLFENTTYFVWSEDGYCFTDSISIDVNVVDCDNIFVPNYLTPNGDGVNDLFRAILPEHTCFTLYIYNRWGALVHLSNHINIGWDGAIINTGEPAAEGTYYYLIEYCTIHEDNLIAKGSLTLIRE